MGVDPQAHRGYGWTPYAYCGNNPALYVDPNGEWALVDDLCAAVLGGVVNVLGHVLSGNIMGLGHVISLFITGAAAGEATLYGGPLAGGAVLGAGNSFVDQAFMKGLDNIDGSQVFMDGIIGVGTSWAGGQLSTLAAPLTDQLFSNIASPVLKQTLSNTLTGSVSGFAMGTGVSLMSGASLEDALKDGGGGAVSGAALGMITGFAGGLKSAHDNSINPWTGKEIPANAKDFGVQSTLDRIERGESFPHKRDGGTFENREGFLPIGEYKEYVHPTPGIKGPGPQRIVIGTDGQIYYTPNHYKTFFKLP